MRKNFLLLLGLVAGLGLTVGMGVANATLYTVCASGCDYDLTQLPTATNNATCGDIIQITAGSTVTITGGSPFTLPKKTACNTGKGPHVIIRSSGVTQLRGGVRVTPADAAKLAKITIAVGPWAVMSNEKEAGYYKFHGIEFTAYSGFLGDLIEFGTRTPVLSRVGDNEIKDLAHNIIFEQCYFHGDPASTDGPRRGIRANLASMIVIDSWFENFKNQNGESNAIGGWQALGPFTFRNNYLEAVAITTLFGGAEPTIRGIRANGNFFESNYYNRPWKYRVRYQTVPPTNPCLYDADGFGEYYNNTAAGLYYQCVGGTFNAIPVGSFSPYYWQKNIFELKNAWRTWVRGNYLTNSWNPAAQNQYGAMFLFNLVDNDPPAGTAEPAATVGYVQIEENYGQNTPWVSSIGSIGGPYWLKHNNIRFANNVFNAIGDAPYTLPAAETNGSKWGGNFVVFGSSDINTTYVNNTMVSRNPVEARMGYMYGSVGLGTASTGAVYANNITPWNSYGFYNDNGAGNLWLSIPDGLAPGYMFSRNLLTNNLGLTVYGRPSPIINVAYNNDTPAFPMPCIGSGAEMTTVPATTYNGKCGFPGAYSDIGFTNYATGDYTIASGPYLNWGNLGLTVGANVPLVNQMVAGVNTSAATVPQFQNFIIKEVTPATNSLVFTYNAYSAGTCTVAVSSKPNMGSPTSVTDSGGDVFRTVTVSGLSANTRYYYTVTCDTSYQRTGITLTKV